LAVDTRPPLSCAAQASKPSSPWWRTATERSNPRDSGRSSPGRVIGTGGGPPSGPVAAGRSSRPTRSHAAEPVAPVASPRIAATRGRMSSTEQPPGGGLRSRRSSEHSRWATVIQTVAPTPRVNERVAGLREYPASPRQSASAPMPPSRPLPRRWGSPPRPPRPRHVRHRGTPFRPRANLSTAHEIGPRLVEDDAPQSRPGVRLPALDADPIMTVEGALVIQGMHPSHRVTRAHTGRPWPCVHSVLPAPQGQRDRLTHARMSGRHLKAHEGSFASAPPGRARTAARVRTTNVFRIRVDYTTGSVQVPVCRIRVEVIPRPETLPYRPRSSALVARGAREASAFAASAIRGSSETRRWALRASSPGIRLRATVHGSQAGGW
jgi:hypothetical protein